MPKRIALLLSATALIIAVSACKTTQEKTPAGILASELAALEKMQAEATRSASIPTTKQESKQESEKQATTTAEIKTEAGINGSTAMLADGKVLNSENFSNNESLRDDGIHDPDNNAIDILQEPGDAMQAFPRDRRQQVDWSQALEKGLVEPRADLLGKSKMPVMDLDIIMKNTQNMPWVTFPHDRHTKWLACDNCHPAIFQPKEGANPITMNKVLRGEYCGVCHDKVAFALFTCERCHNIPHEGSGPKWW